MITPSEVEGGIWFPAEFRARSWQCGSAKFGDVSTGAWGAYAKSGEHYPSLYFSVHGRMMSSMRRLFRDNGLKCLDTPHVVVYVRPVENSIGQTILIERPSGGERLGPYSQIPPYSRKYAEVEEYQRPVMGQAYRQPKVRGNYL